MFSEWSCVGTLDGCAGDFKITGGTDEVEGISGSGKMLVRTALIEAAIDLSSGVARPLPGSPSAQRIIRALTQAHDGEGLLAGGDEGLFRISQDLSCVRFWTEDAHEITGSVRSFVDARFAGFVLAAS